MERMARYAVQQGAQPRTLAVLSSLSIGDYFLPALPTQTTVIALGLLQPQRAVWIALAFAMAAAIGASLLALLLVIVSDFGSQFLGDQLGEQWQVLQDQVQRYGVWAVLIASALPSPPRMLTAVAILAGTAIGPLIAAVFVGRLIWLSLFLSLLIRAPRLLEGLPLLGSMLRRFLRYRAEVLREIEPSKRAKHSV